jgi:hypothetical protein
MARRILLDALRAEGVDGARLPLALLGKLDLTLYVYGTTGPGDEEEDFGAQYRDGNDVAFYLVARQAQRLGADPLALWDGLYEPQLDERLLRSNWDDVRATALWHVLDPSLATAVFAYFRQHVVGGQRRVRPALLPVGNGWGVTVGTRGVLGPHEVSRFLDVYLVPPTGGVFTVYLRDLDSSVDRGWGTGAALHAMRLGERASWGAEIDVWDPPGAAEGTTATEGWHAAVELELRLAAHWGVAGRAGAKSTGFFPGTPLADGLYGGFGVTVTW